MVDRNYHFKYLNSSVFTKNITYALSHNIRNSLKTECYVLHDSYYVNAFRMIILSP